MEKIFIRDIIGKDYKTLLSHAIFHCCSDEVINSCTGTPEDIPEEGTKYIEVEFSMNGFPVELSDFLKNLESQLEELIAKKAAEIVMDKFDGIGKTIDAIGQIMERAEDSTKAILRQQLKIDITDPWD